MRRYFHLGLLFALASCSNNEPPSAQVMEDSRPLEATSVATAPASKEVAREPLGFGIARYPGATQLGDSPDFTASNKDQKVRWLQFESNDAPEKVIAFYKAEAEKAGFVVKHEKEKPLVKSMLLETERPQGGILNVNTMVQKDGKTFINLHIGEDR